MLRKVVLVAITCTAIGMSTTGNGMRSRKGVLCGIATTGVKLGAPKGLGFGEPRLQAHCPGNKAPALNSRGVIISLIDIAGERRFYFELIHH